MRRTTSVLACLLAGVLLTAGCGKIGGTGDLTYISGDGKVVEVPAGHRGDPISVSGTTVQGKPLDLASMRGKVVVVNMWWSGCVPCSTEMPMLVDTEKSYEKGPEKDKVAFVGIDIRDAARGTAAHFEQVRGVD